MVRHRPTSRCSAIISRNSPGPWPARRTRHEAAHSHTTERSFFGAVSKSMPNGWTRACCSVTSYRPLRKRR
jgi:hypothetical protein